MRIGLISDTHGYMDDRILHHLEDCDEIWHAGDIGEPTSIVALQEMGPFRAVHGNIDGTKIRAQFGEVECFTIQGLKFLMIHIAGSIGRYNPKLRELISAEQPNILVCGHSHILKVKQDTRYNLLYMNPGAAGRNGFHKVRTLLKFDVEDGELKDLKAIELGQRSAKAVH